MMTKQQKGVQQLHDEQLAKERMKVAQRARAAFSKAMQAAGELYDVLQAQHHDGSLMQHLLPLDGHINAVYQDVLIMEREARGEYEIREVVRLKRSRPR
jgi:hypothetical protein